jgi:hypothetical protein
MKLPLEKRPTFGHPGVTADFESSFCRPAGKIMIESSARSPPATSSVLVLCVRLPRIPSEPPMTMRMKAAHAYQMGIVMAADVPPELAVAWYGYIDACPESLIAIMVEDTVIVHQGSARLMNAITPPARPMMFGFKFWFLLGSYVSRRQDIYSFVTLVFGSEICVL